MSNLARRIVTKIPKRALFQMNVRKLFSNLKFYLIHFKFLSSFAKKGRTQLKKMRIFSDSLTRVDLYVFEGEEFHYRCLDDVSARQSRKIEPLLPKNIRSCGMTYSLEEIFFRYFVTAGLLRKVQTLPHFKISMKKFYNFRQKKFMKIR